MIEPYYIAEWLAFICSFFLLSSKTENYLKWFIPYCFLMVVTETAGIILARHNHSNHLAYDIYLFFDMCFLYWLFTKAFTERKIINTIRIVGAGGLLFYFVNILFIQGLDKLDTYTLLYEFITLAAISFAYLFLLVQNQDGKKFYHQTMFWVSAGMLLYYLPSSIVFSAFEILSYKNQLNAKMFFSVMNRVSNICNVICYIFFSIGFIYKFRLKT